VKIIYLVISLFFITSCSPTFEEESKPFYIDSNGVTIKANDWVTVGTRGNIDGVYYTAVDNKTLKEMIKKNEDYSKIVTTLVNENGFSGLFFYSPTNKVNYDISSWDTSNAILFGSIFENIKDFNQNLNNWDVSKVTNMNGSFLNAKNFNPQIDKWDVGNSNSMYASFMGVTGFNGDLSMWNVENVKECVSFALNSSNFPISKRPSFKNCNPN